MTVRTTDFRNGLLAALPDSEVDVLAPQLRPVSLVLQQVLHERGNPVEDVYFLESGVVSLTADTGDVALVEVGMTGREGLVGTSAVLTEKALSIHRGLVQQPGTANRIGAPAFRAAILSLPHFRRRCLCHVHLTMMQTAQSAACNARHELPQRLARWLLMSHDRAEGDDLPMTQEFLSYMLGVRRAGVSVVTNTLQGAGIIRQSRGRLTILDRARLERQACSCYRLVEDNRLQLMS